MPGLIYKISGDANSPIYPYQICPSCTGGFVMDESLLDRIVFRTGMTTRHLFPCQACGQMDRRFFFPATLDYPPILVNTANLVHILSHRRVSLRDSGLELDISQGAGGLTDGNLASVREVMFALNEKGYLHAIRESQAISIRYLREQRRKSFGPFGLVDRLQCMVVARLTVECGRTPMAFAV